MPPGRRRSRVATRLNIRVAIEYAVKARRESMYPKMDATRTRIRLTIDFLITHQFASISLSEDQTDTLANSAPPVSLTECHRDIGGAGRAYDGRFQGACGRIPAICHGGAAISIDAQGQRSDATPFQIVEHGRAAAGARSS